MEITSIHAEYKRTISDGNYGNTTASLSLTAALGPGDDADQAAHKLLMRAREHVYSKLQEQPYAPDAPRAPLEDRPEPPEEAHPF